MNGFYQVLLKAEADTSSAKIVIEALPEPVFSC